MKYLISLFMIFSFFSCEDDSIDANVQDRLQFIGADDSANLPNDPFTLKDAEIAQNELIIELSYAGGCEEHEFYLVWPEVITAVYPPEFAIYVRHQSNNDLCEAAITETRSFSLSDNPLELSLQALNAATITVINASDETNQVVITP